MIHPYTFRIFAVIVWAAGLYLAFRLLSLGQLTGESFAIIGSPLIALVTIIGGYAYWAIADLIDEQDMMTERIDELEGKLSKLQPQKKAKE